MRRGNPQQGMALILALVAIAIITALLAGILLLVVSHFALSHTNSSYANALNLAEAGINWELQKISQNPALADNTPATQVFPTGSNRSFQVHAEAYPAGGAWLPPGPFWVISTGTVDGVSRTVRVVARGYGLAGLYALFGIDTLNVGGNATINGASGTNGVVNVNGNPSFNGNFVYCGTATGGPVTPVPPGEVFHEPLRIDWPTVNELANQRAAEKYDVTTNLGVDFFATENNGVPYNDNNLIVDIAGNPVPIAQYKLDQGTFQQVAKDANPYLEDGVTPNPLYGKNVIVLGPGDYYFESMDVQGNNGLRIDPGDGIVNIWLGPAAGPGGIDFVNGGCMFFTSHDASRFHLYQGSKRDLQLTGTMDFYGNVYAHNGPDKFGQYYGSIKVLGDGNIWGSVIGYDVYKMTGSAVINFPSNGGMGPGGWGPGPAPGEPIFFYGFDGSWEEVGPA
jgi:hypothetical protein